MRIVLITNGLGFGGAERIIETLATDLRKKGVCVLIVATTRGGPIGDKLTKEGHRVEIIGVKRVIDFSAIRKLCHILSTYRPNIVHSHLAVSDIASAFTRFYPWLPSPTVQRVTTVHNLGVELSPIKHQMWNLALRQMDRVVAVSHAARSALPKNLPTSVVHPSVVSLTHPPPSRQEARLRLGLSDRSRVVLFIGRLVPIKGLDILVKATQLVRTTAVNYLVIGDGPLRTALSNTPLQLLGSRSDAAEIISAADMVVLPSRSEGFPQVPLQAMAAKVPVIGTRVGGTVEIIQDTHSGYLVQPESPTALAKAIDKLFARPTLAQQLGTNGFELLKTRSLTREAMVDRMIGIYDRLLMS